MKQKKKEKKKEFMINGVPFGKEDFYGINLPSIIFVNNKRTGSSLSALLTCPSVSLS